MTGTVGRSNGCCGLTWFTDRPNSGMHAACAVGRSRMPNSTCACRGELGTHQSSVVGRYCSVGRIRRRLSRNCLVVPLPDDVG
jgi:hypothetical protein